MLCIFTEGYNPIMDFRELPEGFVKDRLAMRYATHIVFILHFYTSLKKLISLILFISFGNISFFIETSIDCRIFFN